MSDRIKLSAVFAVVALCAVLAARAPAADDDQKATQAAASDASAKGRFYEMRTYHCNDGKLEALHQRFRNHTNRLFKKHGIEMVGYWTPADAPASKDTLVFILAYPSRGEQKKRWEAFANDPEWIKAKADSEKNGALVGKVDQLFMTPTDYSQSK